MIQKNKHIDRATKEKEKTEMAENKVHVDLTDLDIVLFHGDNFVSNLILKFSKVESPNPEIEKYGSFSHVGVIVSKKLFPFLDAFEEGKYYILEITDTGLLSGDKTPDVLDGHTKFGTQYREFHSVIDSYPGKMAVLKWKENPTLKNEKESDEEYKARIKFMGEKSRAFHDTYYPVCYQLNPVRLLASAMPLVRYLRKFFPLSDHWKMCSDLVTTYLQHIHVISSSFNSENVIPQDFIYDNDHELDSEHLFVFPPIVVKDKH